jgi:hypothetical protein
MATPKNSSIAAPDATASPFNPAETEPIQPLFHFDRAVLIADDKPILAGTVKPLINSVMAVSMGVETLLKVILDHDVNKENGAPTYLRQYEIGTLQSLAIECLRQLSNNAEDVIQRLESEVH